MRHDLIAALLVLAAPAAADVPHVVTDIAPVHSLVSQVMAGVGTPELLIEPGASPHHYAMKPSEAGMLSEADVVFWIGEAQSPWLEDTLGTLAPDAVTVEMLEVPGTHILPVREGELFPAHEHDGGDHEEAGHADHDGHDHDGHDDHAAEDHDEDGHDDHAAEDHDGHAHDGVDPHAWLDPRNAQVWVTRIGEVLAEADPENSVTYRSNAETVVEKLAALETAIAERMGRTPGGFVTFHDAYQYFEDRFDMHAHGALSPSDAIEPGPARLAALRDMIKREGVKCLFAEPQLNPRQVATLAEDLNLRTGTLDPIGAQLDPGPDLYTRLVTGIADALMVCLNSE